MNNELQAIKDTWQQKTEAKERAYIAMQAAKLQDVKGENSEANWAAWQTDGIRGNEGTLAEQHLQMCDQYVRTHSNEFDELKNLTLEQCVQTLEILRAASQIEGNAMASSQVEDMMRIEVWVRNHFEPQNIGGEVTTRIRMAGF